MEEEPRGPGKDSDESNGENIDEPETRSIDDVASRAPPCVSGRPDELACSLYISRAGNPLDRARSARGELRRSSLEEAIRASNPQGDWHVSETSCGLIATFARDTDAEKLLQRGDLARIFEGPVQVARFLARDSRYRQAVLLRDVPWAIPLQDLTTALSRQGVSVGVCERARQHVRVEILDPEHCEALLRRGLDFFGAARFAAIPERWSRHVAANTTCATSPGGSSLLTLADGGATVEQLAELAPNGGQHQQPQTDGVLQCYRCQGFWHVAANCRHLPRCVRCGEPHSVEFCPRPRNNPVCCHCAGPHHAGYRQCPVRLQLQNATPISITLSASVTSSSSSSSAGKAGTVQQGRQPLRSNRS